MAERTHYCTDVQSSAASCVVDRVGLLVGTQAGRRDAGDEVRRDGRRQ